MAFSELRRHLAMNSGSEPIHAIKQALSSASSTRSGSPKADSSPVHRIVAEALEQLEKR